MPEEYEAAPRHPPLYLVAFAITILLYDLLLGAYFLYLCDPAFPTDLFATSPNKDFWTTLYNPLFRWVGHYAAMIFGITSFTAVFMVWMGVLSMRFSALIVMYLTVNTSVLAVLLEPYLVGVLNIDSQGFLAVVKGQTVNYYNMIGWSLTHIHSFFPLWSYWLPLLTINYFIIEYVRQQSVYGEYRYFRTLMCRYSHCPSHILLLVNEGKKKIRQRLAEVHQKNLGFQDNQLSVSTVESAEAQDTDKLSLPEPIESTHLSVAAPPDMPLYQEIQQKTSEVSSRFAKAKRSGVVIDVGSVNGRVITTKFSPLRHFFFAGKTRSGKSLCATYWLLTLCNQMSPKELEIYYLCGKDGSSTTNIKNLPHIKKIATDDDEVMTMLREVAEIVSQRNRQMADTGAENITVFNAKNPQQKMSTMIVYVDEASDLVDNNPRAVDMLAASFRKSLSTGMAVWVAFTDFDAKLIPNSLRKNYGVRMIFNQADGGGLASAFGGRTLPGRFEEINPKPRNEAILIDYERDGNAMVKVTLPKLSEIGLDPNGLLAQLYREICYKYQKPDETVLSCTTGHTTDLDDGGGNVISLIPKNTTHDTTASCTTQSLVVSEDVSTTNQDTKLSVATVIQNLLEGKDQVEIAQLYGKSQQAVSKILQPLHTLIKNGRNDPEIAATLKIEINLITKYRIFYENKTRTTVSSLPALHLAHAQ